MELFIVIVCLAIFTSLSADCPPGEYKINDLCCPMCHIGTVVRTHCSSSSSSNVCIPCVKGTYMDHPNGLTKCSKCTECDTGAALMVIKECTYTSDTVCDCKPGYYCEKGICDLCQPQTICVAGQYVKVQGTSKKDNGCENCPAEHFSTTNMSTTCTAWTKCADLGQIVYKQGAPTSDSVCKEGRNHVLAGIAVGFTLILSLVIGYFHKDGKSTPEKDHTTCPSIAVQETANGN